MSRKAILGQRAERKVAGSRVQQGLGGAKGVVGESSISKVRPVLSYWPRALVLVGFVPSSWALNGSAGRAVPGQIPRVSILSAAGWLGPHAGCRCQQVEALFGV